MRARVLLVGFLLISSGCLGQGDDLEFLGIEYRDPPEAPDFTLFDQNGEIFELSDHEGKVIVVAFVYTSCPDICLIISSNLDYVYDNLGYRSEEVLILSVTIDPARDTINHLSEWTENRGYEWPHLTGPASELQRIYRSWNVIIDNEHIEASQPPEESLNRLVVLYPDNSSSVIDRTGFGMNGSKFISDSFNESSLSFDITDGPVSEGTLGEWSTDGNWTWVLHSWDPVNESWIQSQSPSSSIEIGSSTHLAWLASNANLSLAPPGFDCNGHGWIMGTGSTAHCMCDEGYERPDGDWLSCMIEGSSDSGDTSGMDPHDISLGEYEVGHSTTTFIVGKEMRKRVAYSGIHWDADDFLQDVITLVDE